MRLFLDLDQEVPQVPSGRAAPVSAAELIAKVKWVQSFIEYARYELQPGEAKIGSQFPHQADADKATAIMREVEAALLGPVPVSEGPLKTVLSLPADGGKLLAHFYDYDYFERVQQALAAIGSRLPGPPPPTCSKCRTSWSADGVYICPECGWSQPYRAAMPQAGGPVPKESQ